MSLFYDQHMNKSVLPIEMGPDKVDNLLMITTLLVVSHCVPARLHCCLVTFV